MLTQNPPSKGLVGDMALAQSPRSLTFNVPPTARPTIRTHPEAQTAIIGFKEIHSAKTYSGPNVASEHPQSLRKMPAGVVNFAFSISSLP